MLGRSTIVPIRENCGMCKTVWGNRDFFLSKDVKVGTLTIYNLFDGTWEPTEILVPVKPIVTR